MKLARRVLGVFLGYAIFAASAVLLFALTGRDPHAPQDAVFMAGSVVCGMLFAAVGGYVSAVVAGGNARSQATWVGVIIAVGAAVSLLSGPATSSIWSRLTALIFMAPSALVGGVIRQRQVGSAGARRS